jgi:tetratricopeptide (TPR) repeat protein
VGAVFRAVVGAVVGAALCSGGAAWAQDDAPSPLEPVDAVEAYLQSHHLDDLLSTYLLDQLRGAPASEREAVADRLGRHYAGLLSGADTPDRQREVEARARELLDLVPGSDAFELRLTLFKASFLLAEETAQRFTLRLADADEVGRAAQTFRTVEPSFEDIGRRVDQRVEALERMEDRSTQGDISVVRDQLADARRLRSLAMYYAGWSQYYQALINDDARMALAARRSFGWLLNAPGGREPELAALPASLLRYEHVARAAMAVALSYSVSDQDAVALQWLDAIEAAGETPESIRGELWGRRIEILGRARRWSDLQRLVDRRRLTADPAKATALPVAEARMLAVVTLEALAEPGEQTGARRERDRLVEAIAQVALGDLVTEGEIGHVLDLVKRFGTTPMGDSGFVVLYVRALRAYERAREAHESAVAESGTSADDPTDDAAVANRYMDAVRALEISQVASDAGRFPAEFTQARMMQGLSLYYAGELAQAATLFESVFDLAEESGLREEALWYAIVSLDRAFERGFKSVAEQRDRLATVYLQAFPATDRAATLLLRRVDEGLLTDAQAIAVLLDVPAESPLYEAARRHASRLMYRKYRASSGPERDYAAARFMEVAEELITLDVAAVRGGAPDRAAEAGEFVALRVRQALDAALSITVPDLPRAERLLRVLDDTATLAGLDLSGVAGELAYRRLQIALARQDDGLISAATAELDRAGGVYARSGERLLYQRSVERWQAATDDADAALRVVGAGTRVLAQFEPVEQHKNDPAVTGVINSVAAAATAVWEAEADAGMRAIAVDMDRRLVSLGKQSAVSLHRLARNAESAGDLETALQSWNTLMAGLQTGSDGWFEARVQSIRVLARVDPGRARAVLDQHRVLYPSLAPEPWGEELRGLESQLSGVRPSPEPGQTDATGEGGGGG